MTQLEVQWNRIRRRWVLVVTIGAVAMLVAIGATLLQGRTYTGRAVLTIVSQDRTPDQDAVLAQGYADYFNQPSSQSVLRKAADVGGDVTLNARIAAASPILYVEATSTSPDVASSAATRMAVAFRDDVRANLTSDRQRQLDALNRQLADAQARSNIGPVAGRSAAAADASRIQDQINNLPPDTTNQLQSLQLDAGVVANPANVGRNAATALVGGLLLGLLLAVGLGRFENRVLGPHEVRDRLGLDVLAEVDAGRSDEEARSQLLSSLMGLTNPDGVPVPGVLAVTSPRSARTSKSQIAVALAALRAMQRQTTLLLQADLQSVPFPSDLESRPGVSNFLSERDPGRIDGKVFADGRGLLVGPPGTRRADDLYALYSKAHVQRLVRQSGALADLVVVDAPTIESEEGQVVCAPADRALLVLEEGKTRSADAIAAVEALAQTGTPAVGVALVRQARTMPDHGFLSGKQWTVAKLPTTPPSRPAVPVPAPSGPLPGHRPQPGRNAPLADRTQPISREQLDAAQAAVAAGLPIGRAALGSSSPSRAEQGASDRPDKTAPEQSGAAPLNGRLVPRPANSSSAPKSASTTEASSSGSPGPDRGRESTRDPKGSASSAAATEPAKPQPTTAGPAKPPPTTAGPAKPQPTTAGPAKPQASADQPKESATADTARTQSAPGGDQVKGHPDAPGTKRTGTARFTDGASAGTEEDTGGARRPRAKGDDAEDRTGEGTLAAPSATPRTET